MYLVSEFRILKPLSMLSLMYGRYTKPPSWRNLAKRPTPQRGSRDAAECADAGCTGATGTRGYGGCAGAAVLGCGRGVPLKTAVESSPWTERGAPKSALTHPKQTQFSPSKIFFKRGVAACWARFRCHTRPRPNHCSWLRPSPIRNHCSSAYYAVCVHPPAMRHSYNQWSPCEANGCVW